MAPSGRFRTARRCCSNWLVTEPSWVQWPVLCGRMASSLIRKPAPDAGGLEQLHGHDAGDAEFVGDPQGGVLGGRGDLQRDVQGRGDDFIADAVDLDGVHHGPGP